MSSPSRSRVVLLTVAGLVLAACSDGPTGPSTPSTPDVAALLGEMSPASVGDAAALASPIAGISRTTIPGVDPGKCAYSAASGFFECPTVTVNGLTFTRKFRLIDAAGNSQSKPDGQTSAIQTIESVDGTLTTTVSGAVPSSSQLTIHGTSDHTLSGIRADQHTLNGTSTHNVTGTVRFGDVEMPINSTVTERITNLLLPNPRAGRRWPKGLITIDEVSGPIVGDPSANISSHTEITFDGTSIVTVKVTYSFGTITCTFDLEKQAPVGQSCS